MNFFKRSPPPPVLPPPKQNFHQRFQEDDLAKRSMPIGEFSSNPPLRFGHLDIPDASTKKSTGVQTGENSSMGPRIGDADTKLWRGERIRNSPSELYRPRNLPDPSGLLGLPRSAPPPAPDTPWIRAVRALPGVSPSLPPDWSRESPQRRGGEVWRNVRFVWGESFPFQVHPLKKSPIGFASPDFLFPPPESTRQCWVPGLYVSRVPSEGC